MQKKFERNTEYLTLGSPQEYILDGEEDLSEPDPSAISTMNINVFEKNPYAYNTKFPYIGQSNFQTLKTDLSIKGNKKEGNV